jgi:hypothetical protein
MLKGTMSELDELEVAEQALFDNLAALQRGIQELLASSMHDILDDYFTLSSTPRQAMEDSQDRLKNRQPRTARD